MARAGKTRGNARAKCKAPARPDRPDRPGRPGPPPSPDPAAPPFSRPWMGTFLSDALGCGDVAAACKRSGITLGEYHTARARDTAFGIACVDVDEAVRLTIRTNLEARAASGDTQAVKLLARGLGKLDASPPADDLGRIAHASELEFAAIRRAIESGTDGPDGHWWVRRHAAGMRHPEDGLLHPQVAYALRHRSPLPTYVAAMVEAAADIALWRVRRHPELTAADVPEPCDDDPDTCPWCGHAERPSYADVPDRRPELAAPRPSPDAAAETGRDDWLTPSLPCPQCGGTAIAGVAGYRCPGCGHFEPQAAGRFGAQGQGVGDG